MNHTHSNIGFKAFLMLIISGCLVGLGPVIAKLIAAPAVVIVLYRVALPIPLLYIVSKIKRPLSSASCARSKCDKLLMILIGLFFALDLTAFYISLKYTSVAVATLLSNLSPIFLTSYALITNRRISKELIWLLFATVGLVFLCGARANYSSEEVFGYLSALSAAAFFSGYIVLVNKMGKAYSSESIMLWSSVGAALFLLFVCFGFNIDIYIKKMDAIFYILILAFGVQLVGQTLLTKAISAFPPAFSSLGILMDPVAAAFFAWLILHEPLTSGEIFGATLILISIVGPYKLQKDENNVEENKRMVYAEG